jgi:hypothetical protein
MKEPVFVFSSRYRQNKASHSLSDSYHLEKRKAAKASAIAASVTETWHHMYRKIIKQIRT